MITNERSDNFKDNLKEGFTNLAYESEKTDVNANEQNVNSKVKQDVDFDDIIPKFGNFGKYQIILFLLLGPFTLFFVFVYFTQIFITLIPEKYWCHVPELQHLELEARMNLSIPLIDGEFSKCTMYAVNYTQLLIDNISEPDPTWETQSCVNGFEFDHSEITYTTIATELEWVCENDILPTIAQSLFFLGAITGGLSLGWIADRFGRVPALVAANVVGGAAGIITAFANSFWTFTVCRYFAGFAFDNCFTLMYILVLEYVGPKWRTFVANMCTAIYFGIGALVMPWIAFYVNDWKMLTIVLSAPLLFAIFTPWLVPESARWLVSQNKMEKATRIIEKFERVNKKTIPADTFKQFLETCNRNNEELKDKTYSFFDLFKTPHLRKIALLTIVIYMSTSLVYDGYIRSITTIGFNVFVAFTLASATEFPASFILTFILDKWGRRWLMFGTMALCALCSLALSFTINGNVIVSVVLMIVGRFFVNCSYNIAQQISAEYLPTVVRGIGVAFIHNLGYVANLLSPVVIYLQSINSSLPFYILTIVGLIGGSAILVLPETMDKALPQTLEDGENFGLDDTFWYPCVKPRKNSDAAE
ncbi:hypothetical protein HA402_003644 [Bradysia odoriphaga]|nr:hypothetical protein HA402_003644 [Bradysia odoriphaga]